MGRVAPDTQAFATNADARVATAGLTQEVRAPACT